MSVPVYIYKELYKINISKESDVERLILLLIGRAIMNEPVNLLQTLANHALTNCRKCSSSLKSSYSVGQINKDLGPEEIRNRPTRPYSSISMHPECCSLQHRVRLKSKLTSSWPYYRGKPAQEIINKWKCIWSYTGVLRIPSPFLRTNI